jgi:hypothetical protein
MKDSTEKSNLRSRRALTPAPRFRVRSDSSLSSLTSFPFVNVPGSRAPRVTFEKVTSPFLLPFFHAVFRGKTPQNAICDVVTFSGRVSAGAPQAPSLTSFPYVNVHGSRWTSWNLQLGSSLEFGPLELGTFASAFRAYPRLTTHIRPKNPFKMPNRAKKISGGFRASIRGCASGTAAAPQDPATTRTNLRLLAALAPTCAEKKFCRFVRSLRALCVSVVNSGHIAKSSRIKPSKGKFSQLKPSTFFAHNPARNPNLTLSPVALWSPTDTYGHQFSPNVTFQKFWIRSALCPQCTPWLRGESQVLNLNTL